MCEMIIIANLRLLLCILNYYYFSYSAQTDVNIAKVFTKLGSLGNAFGLVRNDIEIQKKSEAGNRKCSGSMNINLIS